MFFDDWSGIARVAIVGTCAYAALIVLLRVSGGRTLAKLNAFDFVITIALGSTLATVLLSSSVTLAEGVTALGLLVGLQYLVAWSSARSSRVERLVKSEPRLVYRHGFVHAAMRTARITSSELQQAARGSGHRELTAVAAIVLETDGTLSILGTGSAASSPGRSPDGADDDR